MSAYDSRLVGVTTAPTGADDQLAAPSLNGSLGDELRTGRLLVAVSGARDTAAPVIVAHALARRYGSEVSAIQVLDISDAALPPPLTSVFTLARNVMSDEAYADDARARRQQFTDLLGEPNAWPVHIALGTPASEILREARARDAALIVMGLRRHGVVDRMLRDETTLTVARRARAMVFGVVPSARALPRTAVIGVDFGPASIRAARAALDVIQHSAGAPGALHLVYVDPRDTSAARDDTAGEGTIRRLGVRTAFERLIDELGAPSTVLVTSSMSFGRAGPELLAFATGVNADLIAVGSHRHERLERWIVGSVTTEIVRDGRCSVLVIPPKTDESRS